MSPIADHPLEIWFLTGSQTLYGEETLRQVADQSRHVADRLEASAALPVTIVWKPVLADSAGIHAQVLAANSDPHCAGVITWMHTFSPAKMWIAGMDALRKPHVAPAYASRCSATLVHHRHGFHEPEPGGSR